MIRTEDEYQEALRRLEQNKAVIAQQQNDLKTVERLTPEEIDREMEPLLCFHAGLQEEVELYEKMKRGDVDPISDLTHIGKFLIGTRIALDISQSLLAQRLGLSEDIISHDEKNEYHGVTVEKAQRILDVLGVHISLRIIKRQTCSFSPGSRKLLFKRLSNQKVIGRRAWTRDELYKSALKNALDIGLNSEAVECLYDDFVKEMDEDKKSGSKTDWKRVDAKSKISAAIHETARDFYASGLIDAKTMCEFDKSCLETVCWRVETVRIIGDNAISVRFEDGLEGIVRFQSGFFRGVFSHLADPAEFRKVSVIDGAVTWPGELDLAPDAMYEQIRQHGEWLVND